MDPEIEITGMRVRPVRVPLRRTLNTRVGRFTHGPFLLIDLELKGGGVGRVAGFTFIPLGQRIVPILLEELVASVKGRRIGLAEVPQVHDACQRRLSHLGHEGLAQMAISMFDMALHDALAREASLPLYRLLGGSKQPLPTYHSCGLGIAEPLEVAREAREMRGEHGGFTHLKLRLGRERADDDVAAVKAVLSALGPEVTISVDFNQGLPVARALETCRAIDNFGLAWIEEPVAYDDYDTQARLARKLATPLQVGENWWSWRVGKAAIEQGATDYVMPDLLRIGGVTGWLRLARVAEAHSVPFSSHLSPDFSAHVLAATPTKHWLEFMDWGQDLMLDPLLPVAGFTTPPDRPGTGVEWNEPAIARCLI
ncbi:MAG TPA: enolase C-terminal domain-like protein [Hyphomicrobiaceae bacterium]|jgi:mandelate racemase|nr:enolase C-terminal domain-like protein [Hyphomicrobiaceae bacterium]